MSDRISRTIDIHGHKTELLIDEEGREFIMFHGEKWFYDEEIGKLQECLPVAFTLVDDETGDEWWLGVSEYDGEVFWSTYITITTKDDHIAACHRYDDIDGDWDPDEKFILTPENCPVFHTS